MPTTRLKTTENFLLRDGTYSPQPVRRIVGEACHFIDLLRFLAGSPIRGVQAVTLGPAASVAVREDKISFTMSFEDGRFGTVHYLANGHRAFPKERLEIFCGGRVLQIDNFKVLKGFGWPGFKRLRLWRQDKGQKACTAAFVQAIRHSGTAPIPFAELAEVTRVSFEVTDLAVG